MRKVDKDKVIKTIENASIREYKELTDTKVYEFSIIAFIKIKAYFKYLIEKCKEIEDDQDE